MPEPLRERLVGAEAVADVERADLELAAYLYDHPSTRAGLQDQMGLSRTALGSRLDRLFAAGLVRESSRVAQSGGRPARLLEIDATFGLVASVDIGEIQSQVVVCSLEPSILARREVKLSLDAGPEVILDLVWATIRALLDELGEGEERLLVVGLALPAPVDFPTGVVSGYSVLQGWDGFAIRAWFAGKSNARVLVENDVNAMAVAEKQRHWGEARSLIYVKAGTGIGSAIFMNGELYRGAQGAAGDIGHIRLEGAGGPLCRCGNRGCLEALTAGWAVVRDLAQEGIPASSTDSVLRLADAGNARALQALRDGGRLLGEAVAHATSLLNPEVIVIGGSLAAAGGFMLSGVRQTVYARALPLATRRLALVAARVGRDAAVLGMARLSVVSWLHGEIVPQAQAPAAS